MRTCLTLFLAVLLSLNAAYAAAVDICDALEHSPSHAAAHFGHHNHDHSGTCTHDNPPDHMGKMPAASDHHHDHVHPGFSSILPGAIGVMPLAGRSPMTVVPASTFVSALQTLPDRPPRAALA